MQHSWVGVAAGQAGRRFAPLAFLDRRIVSIDIAFASGYEGAT